MKKLGRSLRRKLPGVLKVLLNMRPEIFQSPEFLARIVGLLECVHEGRHLWIADDAEIPIFEAYLREHLPYLAEAYIDLARKGVVELQWIGSLEKPAVVSIHSADLEDLARDLSRPAVLALENHNSDGSFIMTLCQVFGAKRLLDARSNGWLEFRHGGGGGSLTPVALEEIGHFRRQVRVAVLFDSDRLVPGTHTQAHDDAATLAARGAIVHVLDLREIENYIPNRVLAAVRPYRISSRRLACVKQLTPEQRGVYDMKSGFGPASSPPNVPADQQALFAGLSKGTLEGLRSGFGKNVMMRMADMAASLSEQDFLSLGSTVVAELTGLLQKIASIV